MSDAFNTSQPTSDDSYAPDFPHLLSQSEVMVTLIDLVVCAMGSVAHAIVLVYFVAMIRNIRKRVIEIQVIITATCISVRRRVSVCPVSAPVVLTSPSSFPAGPKPRSTPPTSPPPQHLYPYIFPKANLLALLVRTLLRTATLFGGPYLASTSTSPSGPLLTSINCQILAVSSIVPWGGSILGYAQLAVERYCSLFEGIGVGTGDGDGKGQGAGKPPPTATTAASGRGYCGMSRRTAIGVFFGGYGFSTVVGIGWDSHPLDIFCTAVSLLGMVGATLAILLSSTAIRFRAQRDDRARLQDEIKRDPFGPKQRRDKNKERQLARAWNHVAITFVV
ncbi:hypothetical protein HDU93_001929 [Gonapodya sp. JEL0774]|nr:hypothetical protein HDU93_001929 [Gonapodya sp. JEL0774]